MNPGGFGPVVITQADARQLPLPDESVDLIVTSPPFLNLRSYQDDGAHMADQIGAGTREEFLAQLWEATAEMRRVLKPAGSLFVELGDSYTDKCLNMTPHRYAIGCVDRLGLIKRAEVVWSRPNGLPESVTDRVRRSHSMLFHFVKQPRYFSAVDTEREQYDQRTVDDRKYGRRLITGAGAAVDRTGDEERRAIPLNPLGKLPGSVWSIPTSPLIVPEWLGVDHFAAMAPEVARRVVLGWSPREVCTGCGEGRQPNRGRPCEECGEFIANQGKRCGGCGHVRDWRADRVLNKAMGADWSAHAGHGVPRRPGNHQNTSVVDGYACGCPDTDAPTVPGVILDPFGGAGTSALVASCFGRVGISNDLSADYGRLARWRTTDPGERARVLDVAKPERPVAGQLGLFDGLER
jgi:SAM-dependent methyltransferase